jgi:signal transduction histidine kinase
MKAVLCLLCVVCGAPVALAQTSTQGASPATAPTQSITQKTIDSLEAIWGVYKNERRADTAALHLLNTLAAEYLARNPSKTKEYAGEAKRLAERLGDRYGQALALKNLSLASTQQSNYDDAMELHFEALRIYEELGDKHNIAEMLRYIGVTISRRQNRWGDAIGYFLKAVPMYQGMNDMQGLAKTYVNLGGVYFEKGVSAQALEYYRKAVAIQGVNHNTHDLGTSLMNIGNVFNDAAQYDSAAQYYFRAVSFLEQSDDRKMQADLYNNLAAVYLSQRQMSNALRFVTRGLTIANEIGARETQQQSYGILSDIYEALGNHRTALDYLRQYSDIRDSIKSDEAEKRIAEAQEKYKAEKRDAQIKDLERAQEKSGEQARNLIVGLGLLGTIILLLGYGYNIKQRSEVALQHNNSQLEAANREISRQSQHLAELNNEKNEFMGIVAHDLKNPILSIRLLAQLVSENELSTEERRRFASTIISSSDQMARIINNLLNVNAIERGGVELDITPIDIGVAAYSVFEEYETIADNKGVKLHFESQCDAECLADQMALTQILDNLVSNAIKYSPAGKNVWVRVMGNRAWQQPANGIITRANGSTNGLHPSYNAVLTPYCVRIEIQDEGPGLSDDDKKKLFGKFVRLSAQPTAGEHSTGLGLSIVKKMVTAMHGKVWCESEQGSGATFVVELPQAVSEEAVEETPEAA